MKSTSFADAVKEYRKVADPSVSHLERVLQLIINASIK